MYAELRRLVAEGKDPTGPEGQALAQQQSTLVAQFTRGNADVTAGLQQWWKQHDELLAGERPLSMYSYSKEEAEFLRKALEHYQQGDR